MVQFLAKTIGEIEQFILTSSKRGVPPSHIGKALRDTYGIGSATEVLGCSLLTFLKQHGAEPTIPEDLNALITKASQIRAHLAHIGYPIIGDGKYGINSVNKEFGFKYQQLTANQLTFNFKTDSGILNYINEKTFKLK